MPLQNVLLVKGGESNADKTQVGRISAAGDGHLRRRGLPLGFVQTEQPRRPEDVYQESFSGCCRTTPISATPSTWKAWLLRVTLSQCADLRRSAWFKRTAPMEAAADAATPEPESSSELWQAVHALPDDQRIAVWLHYVEGYRTEEIAEMVGCRPATIRTRLHRAKKAIKAGFGGDLAR